MKDSWLKHRKCSTVRVMKFRRIWWADSIECLGQTTFHTEIWWWNYLANVHKWDGTITWTDFRKISVKDTKWVMAENCQSNNQTLCYATMVLVYCSEWLHVTSLCSLLCDHLCCVIYLIPLSSELNNKINIPYTYAVYN
jgi:hypothetical protein